MSATRVLLACPRYDTIGHAAEDFTWECAALLPAKGREVARLPSRMLRGLGVDIARETAARWAVANGVDFILFADADCRVSIEDAKRLLADVGDAAILAAPMAGRGDGRRNFFPIPPEHKSNAVLAKALLRALDEGKPWDCLGTVGTGACVVPVAALKRITRPWFIRGDAVATFGPALLDTADHPWDDSWFSMRARAAGLPTRVHLGVRSGQHWDGSRCWTSEAMLQRWRVELEAIVAPKPEEAKA